MTLIVELGLDRLKLNHRAKYLGQKSFESNCPDTHTDLHTQLSALPEPHAYRR